MHKIDIPQYIIDRVMERQGRRHAYESLDPTRTALVVVDMQNYFMMEGQPLCCPTAREIVPNVNRLAATLRAGGGKVVWIINTAPEESLQSWANMQAMMTPERLAKRQSGLNPGSVGYELWADLEVLDDDLRINKCRYSAMIQGSSDLEARLREAGIDTVLIAGVATNVCCESTARDAMMRGFKTVMVADANAAFTDEEHNATLRNFLLFFGDVLSTEEVVSMIARAPQVVASA